MNEKFFTFLLFCKNNFAVLQKRVVHGLTVKLFEPSTTGDHDLSFKIWWMNLFLNNIAGQKIVKS